MNAGTVRSIAALEVYDIAQETTHKYTDSPYTYTDRAYIEYIVLRGTCRVLPILADVYKTCDIIIGIAFYSFKYTSTMQIQINAAYMSKHMSNTIYTSFTLL